MRAAARRLAKASVAASRASCRIPPPAARTRSAPITRPAPHQQERGRGSGSQPRGGRTHAAGPNRLRRPGWRLRFRRRCRSSPRRWRSEWSRCKAKTRRSRQTRGARPRFVRPDRRPRPSRLGPERPAESRLPQETRTRRRESRGRSPVGPAGQSKRNGVETPQNPAIAGRRMVRSAERSEPCSRPRSVRVDPTTSRRGVKEFGDVLPRTWTGPRSGALTNPRPAPAAVASLTGPESFHFVDAMFRTCERGTAGNVEVANDRSGHASPRRDRLTGRPPSLEQSLGPHTLRVERLEAMTAIKSDRGSVSTVNRKK